MTWGSDRGTHPAIRRRQDFDPDWPLVDVLHVEIDGQPSNPEAFPQYAVASCPCGDAEVDIQSCREAIRLGHKNFTVPGVSRPL